MKRRLFLKQTGVVATLLTLSNMALPHSIEKNLRHSAEKKMTLKKNDIVLFTGDSITEGFRQYKSYRSANSIRALGNGYVQLAASKLNYSFPNNKLKIYNTGVSGDTIMKMLARLQSHVIDLKPTVVSILIGVNDFNVAFMKYGKGTPDIYEIQYTELLTKIKSSLPDVRFVLGEPYALKGAREKIDAWYPEFISYRDVARRIAKQFNAIFLPYQSIFEEAADNAPKLHFSTDGIHPSLAGIGLMAEAWYSCID
ncbi:MAG TPA: lysophospholipase [Porphyromonadaceae bacterium]|nr:lysophospholipase [Porphyromonadaceae bacterium]